MAKASFSHRQFVNHISSRNMNFFDILTNNLAMDYILSLNEN